MRRESCDDLAELRSAYVDGGLSPADYDRLLRHLAGCFSCRLEIGELRRVRELLHFAPVVAGPAPPGLAERLVGIASMQAREPWWSRPFCRLPRNMLSARRRTRRRVIIATVGSTGLAVAVGLTGYLAAPAPALAAVADPTVATRADFANVLGSLPLGNDAVATVALLPAKGLRSNEGVTTLPVTESTSGRQALDASAAYGALVRAGARSGSVAYRGQQHVQAAVPGGSVQADVGVSFRPDVGATLTVRRRDQSVVTSATFDAPTPSRGAGDDVLDLLPEGYTLHGANGQHLLGRSATVIEARTPGGALAGRWWLDRATGLLLRTEVWNAGVPQLSAGFTSLELGLSAAEDHVPPRLAVPQTNASMLVSSAGRLSANGWFSSSQVAGLTLVRLRSDSESNPDMLHLVYSDGLQTVSVFQRKGRLRSAPVGMRWDTTTKAYHSDGFPAAASWQSGSTVFTVVTDGGSDSMMRVVNALPHEPQPRSTVTTRVVAGWTRLLHQLGR